MKKLKLVADHALDVELCSTVTSDPNTHPNTDPPHQPVISKLISNNNRQSVTVITVCPVASFNKIL